MKRIGVCLLAAAATCVSAVAGIPGVGRTKIIVDGWDILSSTPEEVLAHADLFDKSGFDGVKIMLYGKRSDNRDKGHYNTRWLPGAAPWYREMFLPHKAVLQAFAAHKGLKESLVSSRFAPLERIDWRDDAAWANFAHNAGVLAAFIKECGLKGMHDDNEDYRHTKQWYWLPEKDGGTYEEFHALSRKRGEEIGRAMFTAYPEMVFLSAWHLSMSEQYFTARDPAALMREQRDLWPAFVEGLVAACPETGRLADGNEQCYLCDAERKDFYVQSWSVRQGALGLLSPEMRGRYLSRLVVSGGIYCDMYSNTNKASCWYFPPGPDGTRESRFVANVAQAARVLDDYLWVYGEKGFSIPWSPESSVAKNKRFLGYKPWSELIPGFYTAIRAQTDPEALAAETLAKATPPGILPRKCGKWQHERNSHGKFREEKGELVATGVSNGCFIYEAEARPGSIYAVGGRMKGRGSVTVSWKSKGRQSPVAHTYKLPMADCGDGWRSCAYAVCVPLEADRIVVLCSVGNQDKEEETRFSGICAVRVE